MARYWIADAKGRVLGPVTLDALHELVGHRRLPSIARISRDGGAWAAADTYPELVPVFARVAEAQRRAQQVQEAEQLRLETDLAREKPLHEVFGVPVGSGRDVIRGAYFVMVKRFHPDRVPRDSPHELRSAYEEMFELLASRMREADKLPAATPPAPAPAPGPAPAPAPAAPASQPRSAAPMPAPTYGPEEFVGIERRGEDRVEANVKVTIRNVAMFSDHYLLNISMGGVFLASKEVLPLGTMLNLIFQFEGRKAPIHAEGRVVWENAEDRPKQPRGFGVKFTKFEPEDRTFVEDFVRDAQARLAREAKEKEKARSGR